MRVDGSYYPVRSTAYKSLLDRAKISGSALPKLSRQRLASVLNDCLELYSSETLLLIRDEKISAAHSGDSMDYSVLPIDELLKVLTKKLDDRFPGSMFQGGYRDHSLSSASWTMPGQKEDLLGAYAKLLASQGKPTLAAKLVPAIRFVTSDTGIASAKVSAMLEGTQHPIHIGSCIAVDHRHQSKVEDFEAALDQLFAQFGDSVARLQKLLDIHLSYPVNAMTRICKKLAVRASRMLESGRLASYDRQVYRAVTARTEQSLAWAVCRMLTYEKAGSHVNIDTEISAEEKKQGIQLASEQRHAVTTALTSQLSVITGGPGTGKTLIQRFLLDIYRRKNRGAKIICCAPTGRAARRMEQSTGFPATTIHKALGLLAGEDGDYCEPEMLDADLIVVDEVSMMDIYLANHLFRSVPHGSQLVLIGDADQLPSVGPGAVLSEIIACGAVPVVRLDRIFRQSYGSRIAANAKLIRHGKFRWVSGTGRTDGCKAEGWVHIAGEPRNMVLLTEGPMKADVIHYLTGQTVLAVAGVNTLTQLELILPQLHEQGVERIMTAFDMDFMENPHVQGGYRTLVSLLSDAGFRYGTYLWDPRYKGLDDYVWEHCFQRQLS